MIEIKLGGKRGDVALVDDCDAAALVEHRWCLNAGYASRVICNPRRRLVYMHRLIMQAPAGLQVDHINGLRTDNRRANLRLCTHAENKRAYKKPSRGSSRYRGVSWNTREQKWKVTIMVERKNLHLGYFTAELKAAAAYDAAALKYFGEFAQPNLKERMLP